MLVLSPYIGGEGRGKGRERWGDFIGLGKKDNSRETVIIVGCVDDSHD